jgi:hypothetical protein
VDMRKRQGRKRFSGGFIDPAILGMWSAMAHPTTAPPAKDANDGEKKSTLMSISSDKAGIAAVFEPLYKIVFVIALVLYFVLVCYAWYDAILYGYNEGIQETQAKMDNIFIDNTNDYIVNQYITSDDTNEPYHVYFNQKLIGYVIQCMIAFLYLLAANFFAHFSLHFYHRVQESVNPLDPTQQLGFDTDFLIIFLTLILLTVTCYLLNKVIYNKTFVKGILNTDILNTRKSFEDIRNFTILNLPLNDAGFLNDVKRNNQEGISRRIADLIDNFNKTGNTQDITTIQQMLFAYDLYSYFQQYIPISDPVYNKIDILFSPSANTFDIDVNRYFYYAKGGKGIHTSSGKTAWDDLQQKIHDLLVPSAMDDSTFKQNASLIAQNNLTGTFNDKVSIAFQLGNFNKSKKHLIKYMYTFAGAATAGLFIVGVVNYRLVRDIVSFIRERMIEVAEFFAKKL